jgi:AraC family transcriptional activator of mtrCDE
MRPRDPISMKSSVNRLSGAQMEADEARLNGHAPQSDVHKDQSEAGRSPPASAGVLFEALAPLLRVRPALDDFCRFGGAWTSPHGRAGASSAPFHIITRGACVIERRGAGEIELEAGDALLLPHGDSHVVRSRIGGAPGKIATEFRNAIRVKTTVGAEAHTEIICGRLMFEAGDASALVAALPEVIVMRTLQEPLMARFRGLLTHLREELDAGQPGAALIAADLSRAFFVMLLRLYLEEAPERGKPLCLFQDCVTARVVVALLREPAKEWTLDEMAEIGVTSRATLVRAFRRACGLSPVAYLASLRLDLARQRLAGTNEPICTIAAGVGYRSEGSLSKAFLRRFGMRPGAVRGYGGVARVS